MTDKEARFYFLNVGQGDSAIVDLCGLGIGLIDCHAGRRFGSPTLSKVKALCKERGKFELEFLCITHPNLDHYSGLEDLLKWLGENNGVIRNVLLFDTAIVDALESLEQVCNALRHDEANRKHLVSFEYRAKKFVNTFKMLAEFPGGPPKFYFASDFVEVFAREQISVCGVGPTTETIRTSRNSLFTKMFTSWITGTDSKFSELNDISCLVRVAVGDRQVLFTGDATVGSMESSNDFASKSGRSLRSTVVKAPHHGSKHNTSEGMWSRILEEDSTVVFSAGAHSRFRHPNTKTIDDIKNCGIAGVKLACTNHCESLQITDDEMNIDNALQDSSYRVDTPKNGLEAVYHGNIFVAIQDDGAVRVETQCVPEKHCPHHVHGV